MKLQNTTYNSFMGKKDGKKFFSSFHTISFPYTHPIWVR